MLNMLRIDWKKELDCSDINMVCDKFTSKFNQAKDKHIPVKDVNVGGIQKDKKHKHHIDKKLLAKVKKKHSLWRRFMRTKQYEVYLEYCKVRNSIRKKTRRSKKKMEKSVAKAAKKNLKKFWSYVHKKTKVKTGIQDLRMTDGNNVQRLTVNDKEKADVFVTLFSSVLNIEDSIALPEFPDQSIKIEMRDLEITEYMVMKKLSSLNENKAPGRDGIHPRLICEVKGVLLEPLTIIFNKSLKACKLPDEWKDCQITPIFKKGSKNNASNCRPVSLTSMTCKIMESILRDHINEHMKRNNLYSIKASGFISGRSTTYQLLTVLDKWTSMLEDSQDVNVIYMDFKKAFDKVPHKRCIAKAKSLG
eukprot:gene905-208_t